MRMLSVANVASLLGGTGACAHDCIHSLPEWEHEIVFCKGRPSAAENLADHFGCPVWIGANSIEAQIRRFRPDVVLWHNTDVSRMPDRKGEAWVYYQHSHFSGAVNGRQRCDVALCVSRYLAMKTGIGATGVLHQPISPPPMRDARRPETLTIGRLCTPHPNKWPPSLLGFYATLAGCHAGVLWEFVGCPGEMRDSLTKACHGRARFHDPSRWARSLLWNWHAMIYTGGAETYGRTACEAQQAGCVPIVDDDGGFIEQVREGVDGFLCDSPEEFCEAVGSLVDPDVRLRMSVSANDAGSSRGSMRRWASEFRGSIQEVQIVSPL